MGQAEQEFLITKTARLSPLFDLFGREENILHSKECFVIFNWLQKEISSGEPKRSDIGWNNNTIKNDNHELFNPAHPA